jgi:predicted homoserine dehydrogenase-like protein
MAAADSRAVGALPIGLAHKVKLKRAVAEGATVTWEDVEADTASEAVKIRKQMEKECA